LTERLVGSFTLKRLVTLVLIVVVFVYLGVLLLTYLYAEQYIFQPQPPSYQDTSRIIALKDEGEKISAVYLQNPDARYTILYNHGNAEDIGHLLPTLEDIKGMGFSVFAYDYRGYGTSSGKATEESTYRDSDVAYDFLVKELNIPANRIIALGRSLGGAVAVDLAMRRKPGGLIVESSFVSAYRIMTRVPVIPFDRFKSISKIKNVHCPVLVIHGTKDEVVPFWHGGKLFEMANNPKLSYWVEGAGHNNLHEVAGSSYGQALREFVAMIERNEPAPW
jgi:abhydrolase domain-containing protein 17